MFQNELPGIVMPEIVIFNTIKIALDFLRKDYAERLVEGKEQESILYLMLEDNQLQRYNMFEQALSVFISPQNANEPRFLDVSMGYDSDRIAKKVPHIHIVLNSDSPKDGSLGLGSGNIYPVFGGSDDVSGEYREYHELSFTQQANLIISGDNPNEKVLIWHIIRSLLISFIPHFTAHGFRNISFNGGDIQINTEVTGKMFLRNLTMSYDYSLAVPDLELSEYLNEIYYVLKIAKDEI